MPTRVRSTLLIVAAGVAALGCDPEPKAVVSEAPRMVYVALTDSATGNPIPRSTLRYTVAGDSAMGDTMPRMRGATETRSAREMRSASDSASGNPAPRTLLVTCTDDAGNSVPCRWSTSY
jgi:hypothetical protein